MCNLRLVIGTIRIRRRSGRLQYCTFSYSSDLRGPVKVLTSNTVLQQQQRGQKNNDEQKDC